MREIRSILFGILLLFSTKNFAQDYQKQRNEIFASNVLTNGIIGGVASTFNRKANEKFWPVFTKNFAKGCLGGLIKYTAKYQTYYFRSLANVYFAPVNRAFFFLGHSMVMNASMNDRILENYYCNFYGINFKYTAMEEKGDRLQARLSLATVGSLIYLTALGDKLDLYKTLEYGEFYLDLAENASSQGTSIGGRAMFNSMSIRKGLNGSAQQSVVPHELVHNYQIYDYFGLASIYKKRLDRFLNKSKLHNVVTKFVDLDYEPIFFSVLYGLQPQPRYYKNYFEFEAQHFRARHYIER